MGSFVIGLNFMGNYSLRMILLLIMSASMLETANDLEQLGHDKEPENSLAGPSPALKNSSKFQYHNSTTNRFAIPTDTSKQEAQGQSRGLVKKITKKKYCPCKNHDSDAIKLIRYSANTPNGDDKPKFKLLKRRKREKTDDLLFDKYVDKLRNQLGCKPIYDNKKDTDGDTPHCIFYASNLQKIQGDFCMNPRGIREKISLFEDEAENESDAMLEEGEEENDNEEDHNQNQEEDDEAETENNEYLKLKRQLLINPKKLGEKISSQHKYETVHLHDNNKTDSSIQDTSYTEKPISKDSGDYRSRSYNKYSMNADKTNNKSGQRILNDKDKKKKQNSNFNQKRNLIGSIDVEDMKTGRLPKSKYPLSVHTMHVYNYSSVAELNELKAMLVLGDTKYFDGVYGQQCYYKAHKSKKAERDKDSNHDIKIYYLRKKEFGDFSMLTTPNTGFSAPSLQYKCRSDKEIDRDSVLYRYLVIRQLINIFIELLNNGYAIESLSTDNIVFLDNYLVRLGRFKALLQYNKYKNITGNKSGTLSEGNASQDNGQSTDSEGEDEAENKGEDEDEGVNDNADEATNKIDILKEIFGFTAPRLTMDIINKEESESEADEKDDENEKKSRRIAKEQPTIPFITSPNNMSYRNAIYSDKMIENKALVDNTTKEGFILAAEELLKSVFTKSSDPELEKIYSDAYRVCILEYVKKRPQEAHQFTDGGLTDYLYLYFFAAKQILVHAFKLQNKIYHSIYGCKFDKPLKKLIKSSKLLKDANRFSNLQGIELEMLDFYSKCAGHKLTLNGKDMKLTAKRNTDSDYENCNMKSENDQESDDHESDDKESDNQESDDQERKLGNNKSELNQRNLAKENTIDGSVNSTENNAIIESEEVRGIESTQHMRFKAEDPFQKVNSDGNTTASNRKDITQNSHIPFSGGKFMLGAQNYNKKLQID